MVERTARDPTMEEIVGALRETRQDAGRVPPLTVVGAQPAGRASAAALRGGEGRTVRHNGEAAGGRYGTGSTEVAELREGEIDRLLGENARLNERIVFLLKVIEREQRRSGDLAGGHRVETARAAVVRDVKATLEAELRPILLVLLRMLQTQQAEPAASRSVEPAQSVATQSASASLGGDSSAVDPRRER
jgi:hypothetical protein